MQNLPMKHCYCPLDASSFVVVDVETTGLSPYHDKIVQLSAMRFVDGQPTDSFSTYINPEMSIPARSTAVHGITDDMVQNSPTIKDVKEDFLKFISSSPFVVGYNFKFDLRFLDAEFCMVLSKVCICYDVLPMAKKALRWLENHKLETVCRYIGIDTVFHNALNDCYACGLVFHYLCIPCEYLEIDAKPISSGSSRLRYIEEYKRIQSKKDYPIDLSMIRPDGVLNSKTIVFTGALSFGRAAAQEMAQYAGAVPKSSVSKKTDYVVVGLQDIHMVGASMMSSKEREARELREQGFPIQIIDENEFLTALCEV